MPVKVTLLGTGEALDPKRYNTSYLIEGDDFSIQVDAGYNVYDSLCHHLGGTRQLLTNPDMVLLTHSHGDHTASLSKELLAMWEEGYITGSKRDIIIAGEGNAVGHVPQRLDIDYPGFWRRIEEEGPHVEFEYAYPHTQLRHKGLSISSAPTRHSVPNYAFRFECDGHSFAISGDGAMTPESRKLFEEVEYLFHDGFYVGRPSDGSHASVDDVFDYAKSAGVKVVYIVHMSRYHREERDMLSHYTSRAEDNGFFMKFPDDHAVVEID